ncbi:hypothetical protein CYCD_19560 [Tenuifilaceae bacterium CYCD]|nr:hypothetical protein CYCD_19560 [Tenuifilaceae bacterium CYCD]
MNKIIFLLSKVLLCLVTINSNASEQNFLPINSIQNRSTSKSIDQALLENKVKTLNFHRRWMATPSTPFTFTVQVLTTDEYQAQKPASAFPFDAGFVGTGGVINVSEPSTTEQLAVFKDINQVALFYLCKAYVNYYYNYNPMPAWFSNGFSAFEAHLDIPDATIKTALNSYGGSITSFDVLNDRNNYISKNGLAVSYMFGEFMSVYHCWQYYDIVSTTETTIEPGAWWFETETMEKLISKWNRYLSRRILESDENMRIKMNKETAHFRFYYRSNEEFNFPAFSDTLEKAYTEYTTRLNIQALEKLTFFTIPECEAAVINGVACGNRLTSGTAWSSGLNTSCAYQVDQISAFGRQNRHELGHVMQNIIPQGTVTAWMNEGFACFYESKGPFSDLLIAQDRAQLLESMQKAETYFNHRPTYEETRVYPSPDYGYYSLGSYFVDFIYRRGNGDQTVKEVFKNDVEGYKALGYNTPDDFLNAFYFDFDVRIGQKGIVTLTNPVGTEPVNENVVLLQWIPLNSVYKLNVSVSTDNKISWTTIASETTQTSAAWNVPNGFLGQFYIKFSHPDYKLETVLGPFTKSDANALLLQYPKGGENLFAGDSVSIRWASTSIPSIKIDFSSDNGATWSNVQTDVPTNKRYFRWLVPSTLSSSCKIRLTDMANNATASESQSVFSIIEDNTIGGPYKVDANTVLLMHFDGDLANQSTLSGNGAGDASAIAYSAGQSNKLGQCVKTSLPISVAHCSNLNLTGDWTIEAWVKLDAFVDNNYQAIVTKPGDSNPYEANYSLLINPYWDNVFHYFYFSKTNSRIGVTAAKPILNEWYHVLCTRDTKNSEIKIVVRDKNLNIVASQSQSFSGNEMYTNSKDLVIGDNFHGYIDELRISNVVRDFEKPTAPSSPTPQLNATGISSASPILLSWTNGEGAKNIDLYIDKVNPPATKVLDNVVSIGTYSFNNPDPSTKYYWKVVCRNPYGASEGQVWSFTTAPLTGISEDEWSRKSFSIYPNPSNGVFWLYFNWDLSKNATLNIYSSMGLLVYSKSLNSSIENKVVNDIGRGIFLVQIIDNGFTLFRKIIVE